MRKWAFLLSILLAPTAGQAAKKYDNKVYIFKVEDDKFSKSLSYAGLAEQINPLGGTTRRWMVRTFINKESKEITHQLYVSISYYFNWRFYQAAADDKATDLPITIIERHLDGCQGMCSFTETVGVTLSDEMLREKALTGFQIKLLAKSGDSLILDVTPAQIQSQLTTDNQFLPEDRQWNPQTAERLPPNK